MVEMRMKDGRRRIFIFANHDLGISECTVPTFHGSFQSNGLGTHHVAEVARGMKLMGHMGHIVDSKSIM
jgi:hypothetical protein